MDSLKKVEDIIELDKQGRALINFVGTVLPDIKEKLSSRNSSIDKHNDGWELSTTRCQAFNIRELCYSSFTGLYGSSDTHSDLVGLDSKLFSKYFLQYLNNNKDQILKEVGQLMRKDAAKRRQEALDELAKMKIQLDQFEE